MNKAKGLHPRHQGYGTICGDTHMPPLDYMRDLINGVRPAEPISLSSLIQVCHVALGHQTDINITSPDHSRHLFPA